MRTIILAVLAAMIGIGVANAGPVNSTPAASQQETSADWANG
jgi:hypothetical protein